VARRRNRINHPAAIILQQNSFPGSKVLTVKPYKAFKTYKKSDPTTADKNISGRNEISSGHCRGLPE